MNATATATATTAAAVVFSDIAMRVFGIVRALDDAVSDGDIRSLPALVDALRVVGCLADRAARSSGATAYCDEWFAADAEVARALRELGKDTTGGEQ